MWKGLAVWERAEVESGREDSVPAHPFLSFLNLTFLIERKDRKSVV